ncbi:3-keto-steroid reductase [Neohortaea acidophila]|uniref:3-keto-steroid reductase n=1 Tax=Neohortaea acidophila TaxID=245834 RepID=A0A6A6PGM6_9PEZI|nr:3-keto-steroid reductase [Neohortaea acidophila]KAF2479130.1 3-keto-steroid reductase [Neohortaea acidophila]
MEEDGKDTLRVLVTGANSGLGFATCCRLIDEFLATRPQSQTLHLLYSTRDGKKGDQTLLNLNKHLQKTLEAANARTPGISLLLEPRIVLEGVLVDLTKLPTIKALARQLLARKQRLDGVVWNAGIAGWSGLNFVQATWDILTGLVQATTYPKFLICDVGMVTKPQLAGHGTIHTFPEPPLAQVFCSNVFGHYMLTHWLAPLMTPDTRIVWISSTSALPDMFNLDDLQGFRSEMAYESSKRLTDLLVMTYDLPSTQPFVRKFLPAVGKKDDVRDRPQMILTHPGIVQTSIVTLSWFNFYLNLLAIYVARWIGSPWHTITSYKGCLAAVFAILAPPAQLLDFETRDGKGKWGTSTDVFGNERVARTEVEGWGFGRELGVVPAGSVRTKRTGYRKPTKEMREEFEEAGRRVWREMEELRVEWEKRLGRIEIDGADSVDM